VAQHLDKSGYKVTSLHGNLTQQKRQQALDGFRDGRYEIMIATDIAARGIDVTGISHVINYDMPATTDAYTHRIGRTGRADRKGDAFTFVTGDDAGLAYSLKKVLGEKLQYQSVAGLTVSIPIDGASQRSRRSAPGGKPAGGRNHFSPKARMNSKPVQRSFSQANRNSWTH
jgi:ATP-dependent RNA helicase RhlE